VLDVITAIGKTISDIWTGLWTGISDFFSSIWDGIVFVFQAVVDDIKDKVNAFIDVFKTIIDFIPKIADGFETVFDNVVGFIKGGVNSAIGLVEGMVNGIIDSINGILGGISSVADAVQEATGIELSVPSIPRVYLPRLAEGGTVFPSDGGSIVNVAEAGRPERIEPLDADGLSARDKAWAREFTGGAGGGMTFNITQNPGEDGEALAQRISRIISAKQSKWAPQ